MKRVVGAAPVVFALARGRARRAFARLGLVLLATGGLTSPARHLHGDGLSPAGAEQTSLTDGVALPGTQPARPPRRRLAVAPTLALVGGALFDGTGAARVEDTVVLVQSGHVVGAGPRGSVQVPSRAAVVDVSCCTVLPGLINAHVHSGYSPDRLRAWANAGVTTVRDLGGEARYADVAVLNLDPYRARVVAAGPVITVRGGFPIVPYSRPAVTVQSPAEARATVDQLADAGAGVIKIALECGQTLGLELPSLDAPQAAAAVSAAHGRGLLVSVHVTASADVPRALDAGVDDLAHMAADPLPTGLEVRVAAQGVLWVPTLELWYRVGTQKEKAAVANLRRVLAAGGEVALGTDFGSGYDAQFQLGMPSIEIAEMRKAGMSPAAIIVAATRNGARVCGLGDRLGTVEPGRIADLVVVRGDPLEDLGALANVRLVIRAGVIIRDS